MVGVALRPEIAASPWVEVTACSMMSISNRMRAASDGKSNLQGTQWYRALIVRSIDRRCVAIYLCGAPSDSIKPPAFETEARSIGAIPLTSDLK